MFIFDAYWSVLIYVVVLEYSLKGIFTVSLTRLFSQESAW